jgi:hypothetical protein
MHMHIHQIAQVDGNFGDMLNGWLWRELRPQLFSHHEASHAAAGAAGVRFVGIGTILDRHLPRAPLTVVFGTGTGYAPPPADLASPRWRVYGVRGPLSAKVLGLPPSAALTDPAILLASHPGFRQRVPRGTVFVPHWKSLRFGQWREACALAGIEFVDPCADARTVIRAIAGARKVIAESMHAGIVADAFRVPWVPVVLSREVAPFKWADWASTVGLGYRPLLVGPSAPAEVWRDQVLRRSAFAYIGGLPDAASQPGTTGTPLHFDEAQLLRDHAQAIARVADPWHWRASVLAEAALKRVARAAPHSDAHLRPGLYRRMREDAARRLERIAALDGELSDDGDHQRALQRCEDTLQRMAADHAAGRLQPLPLAA